MRYLVVLFGLTWALLAPGSVQDNFCLPNGPVANPPEFEYSSLFSRTHLNQFPYWAKRLFVATLTELESGSRDYPAIVDRIAESRRDELGDAESVGSSLGMLRTDEEEIATTIVGLFHGTMGTFKKELLQQLEHPVRKDLVAMAIHYWADSGLARYLGKIRDARLRPVTARHENGDPIEAGRVVQISGIDSFDGLVYVEHPSPIQAAELINLSYQHLNAARDTTDIAKKESLLKAGMRTWFVAMRYRGGSASIGRVFWSAAATHVRRKTTKLPAEIDALSMVIPHARFLEKYDFDVANELNSPEYVRHIHNRIRP